MSNGPNDSLHGSESTNVGDPPFRRSKHKRRALRAAPPVPGSAEWGGVSDFRRFGAVEWGG
eukprot:10736185-Alexandrium_andersonii.AAC.1